MAPFATSLLADAATELMATFAVFLVFWLLRSGLQRPRSSGKARSPIPSSPSKCQALPASMPTAGASEPAHSSRIPASMAIAAKEGRVRDLRTLAREARAQGAGASTAHLMSTLRTCVKAQRFAKGLAAYDAVADLMTVEGGDVWSILLFCAVEAGELDRCQELFRRLIENKMPSGNDLVNIVRCVAREDDAEALRGVLAQLRGIGFAPDLMTRNRAMAACTEVSKIDMAQMIADDAAEIGDTLDVVGYNTLMKGYSRAGQLDHCFAIYEEMETRGVQKSELTFGIILEACVLAGSIDRARSFFTELQKSGEPINAVHYTTLIKGLSQAGRLADAKEAFGEMRQSLERKPDLIAYSTLLKALADARALEDAVELLEQMIADKVKPDTIIFHNLFLGLHSNGSQPELVLRVFELMRKEGPSVATSTLSVFIKCLVGAGALGDALAALEAVRQDNGWAPETRLYVQLAWACIRSRWGTKVVEVYEAMAIAAKSRGETIEGDMHDQLALRLMQCGMLQTTADLCRAFQRQGGGVSDETAATLLATAARKEKSHLFRGLELRRAAAAPAAAVPAVDAAEAAARPWRRSRA